MKRLFAACLFLVTLAFLVASCDSVSPDALPADGALEVDARPAADAEFTFQGPMFDIAALPSGGILVADFATVKEIRGDRVRDVLTLPVVMGPGAFGAIEPTLINGLQPIGNGNFFATRSGLDLAKGAALFRATRGNARMVADIETFTIGDWPAGDLGQVPGWKNLECEPPGGFTAGPQTNPYHLTALSGSEVLIADAAGNSLLYAKTNGQIEVVAYFDPVVDPVTGEPLVQFPLGEETCPVEPVPTAVAVGPDGAYYVGELTGTTAENFPEFGEDGQIVVPGQPTPEGLASVWRIEPGSRNVTCPSASCAKVVTGLNSVIDIEFGPDGYLYIVEFERNGFLSVAAPQFGIPQAGGSVKKCDVSGGTCDDSNIIAGGPGGDLFLLGAITFDKWDNLWLLDNVFAPTVRQIDWQ